MRQRAQDIIVLTRSAWQTPGRDEATHWSALGKAGQIGPTAPSHPLPTQVCLHGLGLQA